jgi:serine O-acetyltransferase
MLENIRRDFTTHERSFGNGGFWVMVVFRFGVWSMKRRFLPWRWITSKVYGLLQRVSEVLTGVHLPRETKIGKGFHIIHTGRISIHPDSVIGERCGVMHNVTIGTNMYDGCPTIGNDVFIGCGASVLGKITIGNDVRISANSLVIANIADGAVAMGVPARAYPNMDMLRKRKKKVPKRPIGASKLNKS